MKPVELPPMLVQYVDPSKAPEVCHWFAGCVRQADGVVSHPVLGNVPTCSRCASNLDLALEVYLPNTTEAELLPPAR